MMKTKYTWFLAFLVVLISIFGFRGLFTKDSDHSIPNSASIDIKPSTEGIKNQTNGNSIKSNDIKGEVVTNLIDEFKNFLSNYTSSNSLTDAVKSYDKLVGLEKYKDLLDDKEKKLLENKQQLESKIGNQSTIYSGYASSGIHVLALTQPLITGNMTFLETMNVMRGLEDEGDLMFWLRSLPNKGYYAIDLFVEGLGEQRDRYQIDISIVDPDSKEVYGPISNPHDTNLEAMLNKYKRVYSDPGEQANKEWELYLFKQSIAYPIIKVKANSEEISLSSH